MFCDYVREQHGMIRNDEIGNLRLVAGPMVKTFSEPRAGPVHARFGITGYALPKSFSRLPRLIPSSSPLSVIPSHTIIWAA